MKNIKYIIGSTSTLLLMTPILAFAQLAKEGGGGGQFQLLLSNILTFTNTVLIPFIIGIGFLVFVWGMFWYFIAGGANDEKKAAGKQLMIYATLGFVLIIVFWGIINLLSQSTGLDEAKLQNTPKVIGVPSAPK